MEFNPSNQPTTWFRDRYLDETLELRPPYQRKPVWGSRQKCSLIETMLLGYPIPEIYIHVTIDQNSGAATYAIVDGQQRIRSVLQFLGSEMDPGELDQNKYALDKLPPDSKWVNLRFEDLTAVDRTRIFGYRFSIRELSGTDDEIRDMFTRLNKNLEKLKPQEIRNATYTGPLLKLSLHLADDDYWVATRILTPEAIRRMGDVEFMSELIIGLLHGPQGGSPSTIDEYYALYEDYEDEFPDQARAETLFQRVMDLVRLILPKIRETRWANKTDFYSLFVALGVLMQQGTIPQRSRTQLRKSLNDFARKVDASLANDRLRADAGVVAYVRAVARGANDKKRRADRHAVLTNLLTPYFVI